MQRIKLFCFPYAGGSAMTYLSWKKFLNDRLELIPVELAGRGRRIGEPFYENMEAATEDVFRQVQNNIISEPYAIFGHSMGTIIGYELLRRLSREQCTEPVHAFFSGRFPPFIDLETANHQLPDQEFIQCISQFGAMSAEIVGSRELLAVILPIIRADYRMVELYRHGEAEFKLNCPVTVFSGKADLNVKPEELQRWKECTDQTCTFYQFEGGHFFINDFKAEVANIINETLIAGLKVRNL